MAKKLHEIEFEPAESNVACRLFDQKQRRTMNRHYVSRRLFRNLTLVIERHLDGQEKSVERKLELLTARVDQILVALQKLHVDR